MSGTDNTATTITAAEMLLRRLPAIGADYVFVNSGTDHTPIIEAIAKAQVNGCKIPEFIICPHEHAAMGMAQGYYYITGRGQAVITHTNVGLANTICGLINTWNENVPTLLMSGRAPVTESGRFGTRSSPVNYGQDMRDQNALVRESVKWDFELRAPEQIGELLDRAYAIANSSPKGPVFLGLPREPLGEAFSCEALDYPPPLKPVSYAPRAEDVTEVADLLANAASPVIIAQRFDGSQKGFDLLSAFINSYAIPVVEYWSRRVAVSCEDPMSAGRELSPWLEEADLVIVIDSQAPWIRDTLAPPANCPVVQIGPDPLFEKYPLRSFPLNVALCGETDLCLEALSLEMERRFEKGLLPAIETRRARITPRIKAIRTEQYKTASHGSTDKITKPWLSACLGDLIRKHDARISAESVVRKEFTGLSRPGVYFQEPLAAGLGYAFPIGLGMKLACPDNLVIAAIGDGGYMFSNPVACHQISMAANLPLLIVVGNNREWNAVRNSTMRMYPGGFASKAPKVPLSSLEPSPDYCQVAAAAGAGTWCVRNGQDLPQALEDAAQMVMHEQRSAFVEVILS